MKIIIIVAQDKNRVIGNKGKIPWRLPTDQENFKEETVGHAVLMGRTTYLSLPKSVRPLPDRDNIVLSKTMKNVDPKPNVFTRTSLVKGIKAAEQAGHKKCFIIGGGIVYAEAMLEKDFPVDEIIATEVFGEFEGDAFFPLIDRTIWNNREVILFTMGSEKDSHDFEIARYTK